MFTGASGSSEFDWDTTDTNFASGSPATNGFNNADTNVGSNANNSLIFRPVNALTNITEFAVQVDATDTWQLGLNGADIDSLDAMGTAGYKRVDLPDDFDGTVTSFGLRNTESTETSAFSRIRINGNTVLVDNPGNNYDLMTDSPTQNFATLNRLNTVGGDNGIAAANLQNQDTNSSVASTWTGTQSMTEGQYYFEITRFEADNGLTHGILPDNILITGGNDGLNESVRISQSGDLDVLSVNTTGTSTSCK